VGYLRIRIIMNLRNALQDLGVPVIEIIWVYCERLIQIMIVIIFLKRSS
jgi:hypothetical protein